MGGGVSYQLHCLRIMGTPTSSVTRLLFLAGDSTSWESLPGVSTPRSHITPLHKVAWVLPARPLDPGLPAHVSRTTGSSATRDRDPLGQIQCNQLTAKPRTQLGALARGLASFAG